MSHSLPLYDHDKELARWTLIPKTGLFLNIQAKRDSFKCVLWIVFEKPKKLNQYFCEGRSSTAINKAFLKVKTKTVNRNILPNSVLFSFPSSHWRNFYPCTKLKREGQSFAPLFRVVYGKICWNCRIRVITPPELDWSNSLRWHFQMKPPHLFFFFFWQQLLSQRSNHRPGA